MKPQNQKSSISTQIQNQNQKTTTWLNTLLSYTPPFIRNLFNNTVFRKSETAKDEEKKPTSAEITLSKKNITSDIQPCLPTELQQTTHYNEKIEIGKTEPLTSSLDLPLATEVSPSRSQKVALIVKKKNTSLENWLKFGSLYINTPLFEKGLLVVTSCASNPPLAILGDANAIYQGTRKLSFSVRNDPKKTKHIKTLFSNLKNGISKDKATCIEVHESGFFHDDGEGRTEIFLSFSLRTSEQQVGFYAYPWLSNNLNNDERACAQFSTSNFSGFEVFTTVGHMFGENLKGRDENDNFIDLIKHNNYFFRKQKILYITFNPEEANTYEEMLFSEFESQIIIINNLSQREKKQLIYHLPYYDYILFGVELFVRGRITLSALEELCQEIFVKKEQYIEKIKTVCQRNNIEVSIQSPFDNLFGPFVKQPRLAKIILAQLDIEPLEEIDPEEDIIRQKANEKDLVVRCLNKLQSNSHCEAQQQIWRDFIISPQKAKTSPENLEHLINMANAVMVAVASKGKKDYQVCSFLPLSEKKIQLAYTNFSIKLNTSHQYPVVFNITILDMLITYSTECTVPLQEFKESEDENKGLVTKRGLPFYFPSSGRLARAISKLGLLKICHSNMANYSFSQQDSTKKNLIVELEQALNQTTIHPYN